MYKRFETMWRACRKYLFIVAFGVLLYELCEHFLLVHSVIRTVGRVVAPIIYGLCFAFVVNLLMSFFEDRVFKKLKAKRRGLARGLSMALSYLIILGLIALIIALVVPKLIESISQLVENFDGYYFTVTDKIADFWQKLNLTDEARTEILDITNDLFLKLKALVPDMLSKLFTITKGVFGTLYALLVTLVISIYALIRKEKLISQAQRFIKALLTERASQKALHYMSFANVTFRKYILGQLTSCLIIGVLCYIGMRILNMPYPELISVFICVAALIPIIGPWASTIPSALIILMARQDKPLTALWFIIMIVVIQQLDDNLVYPRIVGDAVGISGIWVLAAIIIAGGLFGIPGLLVAVPTMAVIYRIVGDWTNKRNAQCAMRNA